MAIGHGSAAAEQSEAKRDSARPAERRPAAEWSQVTRSQATRSQATRSQATRSQVTRSGHGPPHPPHQDGRPDRTAGPKTLPTPNNVHARTRSRAHPHARTCARARAHTHTHTHTHDTLCASTAAAVGPRTGVLSRDVSPASARAAMPSPHAHGTRPQALAPPTDLIRHVRCCFRRRRRRVVGQVRCAGGREAANNERDAPTRSRRACGCNLAWTG